MMGVWSAGQGGKLHPSVGVNNRKVIPIRTGSSRFIL